MAEGLNKKVARATKWSSLTEIGTKLVAPITNAILARLLAPEAFGVVATLTMVVSFAEIFTDAGFQKYLVQKEFDSEKGLYNSANVAFWTNLMLSVLIWAGIACFAKPLAELVGSPGCHTAVVVMSAQIPLLAFSSIQMAISRRDFDFKTLFFARMSTALVPLVITVPLAVIFKSYWALVVGTLARDVLNAIVLGVRSKWKPRLYYSLLELKSMISFSIWTVVENISIWLTNYVGTFIISSALNAHYLGLYKTTTTTVNGYLGLITAATTPVLFSALSRCQNDEKAFQAAFFKFQRMVAMLVFPLGVGMFVYRRLATWILLGEQWLEAADFLGLWALTSAIVMILSNYNSEAFRSKGKPRLSVLVQVLHLVVLVPILIWSVGAGFETLAVARSLVRLQMVLVSCIAARLVIGIRFRDVIANIWPSFAAAVVMGIGGMVMQNMFDSLLWQFATVLICVLIYAGVMLLLPAGRKQLAEVPVLCKILRLKPAKLSNEAE